MEMEGAEGEAPAEDAPAQDAPEGEDKLLELVKEFSKEMGTEFIQNTNQWRVDCCSDFCGRLKAKLFLKAGIIKTQKRIDRSFLVVEKNLVKDIIFANEGDILVKEGERIDHNIVVVKVVKQGETIDHDILVVEDQKTIRFFDTTFCQFTRMPEDLVVEWTFNAENDKAVFSSVGREDLSPHPEGAFMPDNPASQFQTKLVSLGLKGKNTDFLECVLWKDYNIESNN